MKTTHLAAGAAVLLAIILAVVLWRQSDLSDELALLRTTVENLPRAAAAPTQQPSAEPSRFDEPRAANTPSAPTTDEERIADLERVVNAQADIIEDLINRLGGMELSNRKATAPAWGAMQAVGAPDSGAGDQR